MRADPENNLPLDEPDGEKRSALAQEFKQGGKVGWTTPQGKTKGAVKKKLTERTEVGGQTVAASEDDPRYLVESA